MTTTMMMMMMMMMSTSATTRYRKSENPSIIVPKLLSVAVAVNRFTLCACQFKHQNGNKTERQRIFSCSAMELTHVDVRLFIGAYFLRCYWGTLCMNMLYWRHVIHFAAVVYGLKTFLGLRYCIACSYTIVWPCKSHSFFYKVLNLANLNLALCFEHIGLPEESLRYHVA
jgi:hypothetical protein